LQTVNANEGLLCKNNVKCTLFGQSRVFCAQSVRRCRRKRRTAFGRAPQNRKKTAGLRPEN